MTHAESQVLPPPPGDLIPVGHTSIWAVAWRLHRTAVFTLLGIMAVAAGFMVWFRWHVLRLFAEFDCDPFPADQVMATCVDHDGAAIWWNYGLGNLANLAHVGMLGGPVVLGVFAAAPIFTREFTRCTHVLALTQAVSRGRWFVAKIVVVLVPLLIGLTVLGFLVEWVDGAVGETDRAAMSPDVFLQRGIMPAVIGLATVALVIAIGMIARGTTATLVAGLIGGFALLAAVGAIQPHVAALDRATVPIDVIYAPMTDAQYEAALAGTIPWPGSVSNATLGKDDAWVDSGFLDRDGREVDTRSGRLSACYDGVHAATQRAEHEATTGPNAITSDEFYGSATPQNLSNAMMLDCLTKLGATDDYTDILRVDQLWPLRLTLSSILTVLAALFFAAAWYLLPTATARRS